MYVAGSVYDGNIAERLCVPSRIKHNGAALKSAETRWEAGVDIYRRLGEIGFRLEDVASPDRLKVARFSSRKLIFDYSIDLLTGDMGGQWRDLATGLVIPDPLLAICYFSLSSSELDGGAIDDLGRLRLEVGIYLNNSWALEEIQWVQDCAFIRALKFANDGAWEEFRPLATWEFEKILISKRG